MIREDPFDANSFTLDTINELVLRLRRRKLGLVKAERPNLAQGAFLLVGVFGRQGSRGSTR